MKRTQETYPTVAAASRATGVSPATLRVWRDKEQIDVLDPAAVRRRIERNNSE